MSVASMGKKDRTFLDFVAHFSDNPLSLVHAVQDAIPLSNEDEWIHYFMLSMYGMMLSFMHRMSGVVYGNLDFDHKGR